MSEAIDLLVIGSGAAGATVASTCRTAGWSVAIAEERTPGGTCPNRGCDPKKTLVEVCSTLSQAQRFSGCGLATDDARIDWPQLQSWKRSFSEPIAEGTRDKWRDQGVELIEARAHFLDQHRVHVGERVFEPRHVLIATGTRPRPLPIPGSEHVLTSDDFLDLETMPPSMAFIGGGYIAVEFAAVAAATGCQVTLIHRGRHLLKDFDPDLSDLLTADLRARGVRVILGQEAEGVAAEKEGFAITPSDGQEVRSHCVMHSAGRTANIENLDLAAAGIATDGNGIAVDEYLRTSQPHIFAAGDCTGGVSPPLLPVASRHGKMVAAGLLGQEVDPFDPLLLPAVCFHDPPIASIGHSEASARATFGDRLDVIHKNMSGWSGVKRLHMEHAASKVLVHGDRIVGAHVYGPHAEDTINCFLIAMAAGMSPSALRRLDFGYPTHSGTIGAMAKV